MKFRLMFEGLETRENPVGPQMMEDPGFIPPPPPPQSPPPQQQPPDNGPQSVDPVGGAAR